MVETCRSRVEVGMEKIKCGFDPVDNPPKGCLRDHLNHVTALVADFETNINALADAAIDNPTLLGKNRHKDSFIFPSEYRNTSA